MILILVWSYKQSIESKRIQYFEFIFAQGLYSKYITFQMLSQKKPITILINILPR